MSWCQSGGLVLSRVQNSYPIHEDRSIYLPDHQFTTGQSLSYSAGGGTVVSVSTDGTNNFNLPSQVYSIKLGTNLIGLSTMPVGVGSEGSYVGVASTTGAALLTSLEFCPLWF